MNTARQQILALIGADYLLERAEAHVTSLDNPGFCIKCGAEHDGCEPDARDYECEECGARAVYGAEELAIMLL